MTTMTRTRRIAAIALAAGLALAPATAGIAAAQTTEGTAVDPQIASTIDATQVGSLTVNKFLNPDTFGEPTGNATDSGTGTSLSGVEFTIQRINLDITTPEGFAAAANLTPTTAANQLTDAPIAQETVDGSTTFANLPLGAYLVTETNTAGATDASGNPVSGIVPSPAFIVFVPMTNPDDTTQWNYNPVVYPKNTNVTSTKTVVDRNDNVGDTVDYTITTGIPSVEAGRVVKSYTVNDTYDAGELTNVTVTGVTLGGVALSQGTDYEVVYDAAAGTAKVNFLQAGLDKLNAAAPGTLVETKLTAVIAALGADGDGQIVNKGSLTGMTGLPNSSDEDVPFETPETQVETYIAKLQVNKVNEAGAALDGATFQLYQSDTCTTDALKELNPLQLNGVDSWTTTDGTFTIDGLHVTDVVDNAAQTQEGYCLVETEAPAGYELLTDPIALTFTKAEMTDTAGLFVPLKTEKVTNIPSTKSFLPSTGGMGVGLIIGVGALIIGAGAFAARRNSAA